MGFEVLRHRIFQVEIDEITPAAPGVVDEAAAAQQLVTAYRAGVAQGVAVVEQGDRLVDRGAATQALALLDLAEASAARDREKAEMAARPPLALP